jgi:choline-glycine betaine transporter
MPIKETNKHEQDTEYDTQTFFYWNSKISWSKFVDNCAKITEKRRNKLYNILAKI